MKNLKKLSILFLTISALPKMTLADDVLCTGFLKQNNGLIIGPDAAKNCTEEILSKDKKTIFTFLDTHGNTKHLEFNLKDCNNKENTGSGKRTAPSYFADEELENYLKNRKHEIEKCVFEGKKYKSFSCTIKNGPEGCYVPEKGKGIRTTTSNLSINTSGKLVTWFPRDLSNETENSKEKEELPETKKRPSNSEPDRDSKKPKNEEIK